jgi:hypothetical protein
VDERQWQARLEDPRARQELGCVGGLRLLELRESSRVTELALLEDRQRACQPSDVRRQSTEPELDRPGDRPCADPLDVARGLCSRRDLSFSQRPDELAQQAAWAG